MVTGKLMVVDDDKDIRDSLKMFLEPEGYHILEASNGQEAIDQLKSEDNMVNVGAILCDIRMPRVNGLECISFFRREAPGIPIIVITGFPETDMAVDLLKKGCKDYLTKPVEKSKLLSVVNKVVAQGKELEF
ncbi:response regulator [Nitrospina gracilis]|uniref:response regulator n=1 Tax=Nitrospina gracilis TaxID=35801 RepID=UPI001F028B11|nr:response regulator [Nitrospina gracilis]MCF8720969.1 two-component system chemotaxis response regulator CheY [Nitrospina gracilis Nb-211]